MQSKTEMTWRNRDIHIAVSASYIDLPRLCTVIFAEFASISNNYCISLIIGVIIIVVL